MKTSKTYASRHRLPAALLLLSAQTSHAGSATWSLNAGNGDWNTATNWTPVTVPNGAADTAAFAFSNTTGVSISANTEVNGIVFNSGASAFTITASPTFTLTISGIGITNNSGITQNFVTAVDGAGNNGAIAFTNSATAGTLTAFTNEGGVVGFGGFVMFFDTSTAGNGTFTNNAALSSGLLEGSTNFFGTSTAGNSTFTCDGAPVSGAGGGYVQFNETSTAGNGSFTINGSVVVGQLLGGEILFVDTSTAGNAALIANGGTTGGDGGGIFFFADSTGGMARVVFFAASWTSAAITLRV